MKKLIIGILVAIVALMFAPGLSYASDEKASGSSAVLAKDYKAPVPDTRAAVLKRFLESYESPLASSADTLIKTADENKLDWRLLAAISGVESTFAHQLPSNSYNAWGWGIYGNNMIYFKSYDEAITTISKGLRTNYIDKWGADDVYDIGRYYAASPTWAQRVEYFMNKMTEFQQKNPETALSISL